jgi:protease I
MWADRLVVTEEGLVTSRNPDDLPAYRVKIVEEFAEDGQRLRKRRSS